MNQPTIHPGIILRLRSLLNRVNEPSPVPGSSTTALLGWAARVRDAKRQVISALPQIIEALVAARNLRGETETRTPAQLFELRKAWDAASDALAEALGAKGTPRPREALRNAGERDGATDTITALDPPTAAVRVRRVLLDTLEYLESGGEWRGYTTIRSAGGRDDALDAIMILRRFARRDDVVSMEPGEVVAALRAAVGASNATA